MALPPLRDNERTQLTAFDAEWYLATNPDVASAGMDALEHYVTSGRDEGRLPGPTWDDPDDLVVRRIIAPQPKIDPAEIATAIPGRRHSSNGARILVVGHAAGLELYGAERSLLELLDGFATLGHDIVVAVPTKVNDAYIEQLRARCRAVHIAPVPPRRPNATPNDALIDQWCKLIDRYSIQAVHVNTIMTREPLLAARRSGVAAVVHAHEIPFGDSAMCAAMDASADEIVTSVTADATYVIGNSSLTAQVFDLPGRTAVVPNIVDIDMFSVAASSDRMLKVALIGGATLKKGVRDFARLAATLRDRVDAQFLVIGPRSTATISLSGVDVPDNLKLAGYATTPVEAVAQADIVVNLSRCRETFARTVLEGMAAALPIVAYNRGAIPLLVDHNRTGILVPFDDADALATAVERLCRDPELRTRLGAAGREVAATRYAATNLARALSAAYTAILPPDDVVRQQAHDVVVSNFPRVSRSEFLDPFFAGYRSRWSYTTGVAFVDSMTLVSNSELGKRMYTIKFDPDRREARIVAEVPALDMDTETMTDLIQSDGRGRVLTANGWRSSMSFYEHDGSQAKWIASLPIESPETGFCHAARFVPARDDIVAACITTGSPGVRFIATSDAALLFEIDFDGLSPKDFAFKSHDRAAAALHRRLIEAGPVEALGGSIALVALDLDTGAHKTLDEIQLPDSTLDGLCFHNERLYATDSGADAVMVFDTTGDRLCRLADMKGFSFPHQVAVSPDGLWLAVACFGDSTVVLRPLTE